MRDFLTEALDFRNVDQPLVSYPLGATRWVTGTRGYLRGHGRRQETWFEFGEDRGTRYDYLYALEELEDQADRARKLMEKAATTTPRARRCPTPWSRCTCSGEVSSSCRSVC